MGHALTAGKGAACTVAKFLRKGPDQAGRAGVALWERLAGTVGAAGNVAFRHEQSGASEHHPARPNGHAAAFCPKAFRILKSRAPFRCERP
jgi:hypothetical protein